MHPAQRVPSTFRVITRFVSLTALFLLGSCVAGVGDLGLSYPTLIQVRAVFPAGFSESASGLVIDRVAVQIIRPPSEVLADTVVDRGPDEMVIPLELEVELESETELLMIRVMMLSGSRLVLEGEEEAVIEGARVNQSPDVSLSYVAGGTVEELEVLPVDSAITFGDALNFQALAYDALGNPMSDFYVSWTSSDPDVFIDALGRVEAPSDRRTTTITAKVFEGPSVSTSLRFVPPAASVQVGPPGSQQPGPATLTAQVLGEDGLGIPFIRVEFVAITPGGSVANSIVWTDAAGFASTQASPGSAPGDYDFEAQVEGLTPARFTLTQQISSFPLTIRGGGTGSGVVTSSPAGISCSVASGSTAGSCTTSFARGSLVTLNASPAAGSRFAGWSGAGCSGMGACQVSMNQAETVTAAFDQAPDLVLTSNGAAFNATVGGANPSSQVITASNGGGGSLGTLSLGAVSYGAGANGWLNPAPSLSSSNAPADVTVQVDISGLAAGQYAASFDVQSLNGGNETVVVTLDLSAQPTFTLTVNGAGAGSGDVTSNPAGITCTISGGSGSGSCATAFPQGTVVTLTASASVGSTFTGWSGAGCSGTGTCQVTMNQAETVTAAFDQVPDLVLSSNGAAFNATVGGANPSSQVITASNGGGGSLGTLSLGAVSYGAGAGGWLSPAPSLSGSSAPADVTIQVDISGLAAGQYTASFDVQSQNGGNETVVVALNVTAQPTFTLTVNGSGAGSGNVTSNPAGIVCAITGGSGSGTCATAFPQGTVVTLTASASVGSTFTGWSGAGCSGTGTCQVTMNQAETVTAAFGQAPDLVLTSNTAAFNATVGGANPSSQLITASNGGGGSLGTLSLGAVSYGAGASGWLSPAPSLSGSSAPADVTIQVDISGLAAGQYTASFDVQSQNGGNETVSVTLDLAAQPTFTLTVNGSGAGSGDVTSNPAGIVCAISGGSGSGTCATAFPQGTVVTLTAVASGGSTFTGWSGAGCSGTGTCQVTMNQAETVTAAFDQAPDLVLTSNTAAFNATVGGANPSSQVITASNGGGGSLGTLSLGAVSYGAGASGWLNPAPSLSGSSAPADVTIQVDISGLAAGQYTASFDVQSQNGGNETVSVTLDVSAPSPVISLTPASLTYTAPQGGDHVSYTTPKLEETQTLWIKNSGGGTLDWTASTGAGWLEINPMAGSLAGGDSMQVAITKDSITATYTTGSYPATVTFSAPGATSENLPVTLDITAGPPAVSSNIQVTGVSTSTVSFQWTNNHSGDATHIQIESWDGINKWHVVDSVAGGATSYVATGFPSGRAVQYRVRTCNSALGPSVPIASPLPGGCPNQALQPHPWTWPSRSAEGEVRASGVRVAGATVTLRKCTAPASGSNPPQAGTCGTYDPGFTAQNVSTNAQGEFLFDYLEPGVYEVNVNPASVGYTSVSTPNAGALPAGSVLYDLVQPGGSTAAVCTLNACVKERFNLN